MYKHLGKSSRFNMSVCESVKFIDKKDHNKALKFLDQALELFPNNKEAKFYKIAILVEQYQENSSEDIMQTISDLLDSFIKEKKNEHMLFYFRGILELYKQEYMNALRDFDKVNILFIIYIGNKLL